MTEMTEDDFWFLIGVAFCGWSMTVAVRDITHRTDVNVNERRALLLRLKQKGIIYFTPVQKRQSFHSLIQSANLLLLCT